MIYDVVLEPGTKTHEIHKRRASQPLRIYLQYDYSVNNLPYEHQNLIKVCDFQHARTAAVLST